MRTGDEAPEPEGPAGERSADESGARNVLESEPEAAAEGLARAFQGERNLLLRLLYQLTGSAVDAEDLLQATFERALSRPPRDLRRPWRPWLVRVAMNLGRDHLRRRRRRAYSGPWLPAPIDTSAGGAPPGSELTADARDPGASQVPWEPAEPRSTEGRYELMQHVSYAFLVALEALTSTQRAVLLLRDVLQYDTKETASALDLGEANVRQLLSRARRALQAFRASDRVQPRAGDARAKQLLERFLAAIASSDIRALESLLTEDVVLRTDAGGEFHAARVPVVGRSKVARFYINIARRAPRTRVELRELNGGLAYVTQFDGGLAGIAPRAVSIALLSPDGRIAEICSILSSEKLSQVVRLGEAGVSRLGPG